MTAAPQRKLRVLFVCIGNMCRSPIAEGFARELGGDVVEAFSAGTRATGMVAQESRAAMDEVGIDISSQRSKSMGSVPVATMDIIVSMAGDSVRRLIPRGFRGDVVEWDVEDPVGAPLSRFRMVRNEIYVLVRQLLDDIRSGRFRAA